MNIRNVMVMLVALCAAQVINAIELEIINALDGTMIVEADGKEMKIEKGHLRSIELPNNIRLKKEGRLSAWHSTGIQEKVDDIRYHNSRSPISKASVTVSGSGLHYDYSDPIYS